MGVKLEKVAQKFYDSLEEGKIMGRKCLKCGAVEFPPVYACNTCGSTDMEWVEIDGSAVMKSIVMPAALSSRPEYAAMGQYAYGEVELKEGSCFNAVVRGINKKKRKVLMDKLPVPVHAEIYQRNGFKTVVFQLDEDNSTN